MNSESGDVEALLERLNKHFEGTGCNNETILFPGFQSPYRQPVYPNLNNSAQTVARKTQINLFTYFTDS